MDRFFLIVYYFVTNNGVTGYGDCTVNNTNGNYINKADLIKQLKTMHEQIEIVVIMNIIEVSKDDYLHYNLKQEDAT